MTTTPATDYTTTWPELSELLFDTVTQAFDSSAKDRMSSRIPRTGLASPAKKKAVKKAPVVTTTEALVADSEYTRPNGDKYYTRKWGEHDDIMVLRRAREFGKPVMLYGAPGCGKTAVIEAAFHDQPGGLYTVMGTGDTEVADFVGGYIQTPSGGFVWEDGPLVRAAEEGGVLLIDEVGLVDPKVLSVVYGLMDGRQELVVTANPERGTVKAAPGFYVCAATNPNAPGVRLSEALLSRFSVQAEWSTDWALARKLGAPIQIVTAAQNLSKKQASNEVSWAPQMRELLDFRDLATTFGTTFAIANLLAAAPEIDRPVVQDVFTRVFGVECFPAKI